MKIFTKAPAWTLAFACSAIPLAASAADDNNKRTYLGAGVGYSILESDDFTNTVGDLSENRGSWKMIVGVKFGPVLSAEAQFIDFGTVSRAADQASASAWTAGVVLDVLGEESISPYGKVGATFWETGSRFNNISLDENGTDFSLGIGVRFQFAGDFSLRTEYERFGMDKTEVDNLSVALLFTF